jgi:hypothetical protein
MTEATSERQLLQRALDSCAEAWNRRTLTLSDQVASVSQAMGLVRSHYSSALISFGFSALPCAIHPLMTHPIDS